jgi:transcriptional regulator with XRE-family HTH domain
MPRAVVDWNRADMTARNLLVDQLASRRAALGYSQERLASLAGVSRSSVVTLETQRPANPKAATLQAYGNALRTTLHLDLADLPVVPCAPADVLLSRGLPGRAAVARLRAVREHLGISRLQVEAEHGWRWSALASFENSPLSPMLAQIQRLARICGGSIDAWWEPC